ncbi:MAG: hypothetical protein HZB51_03480 [Chloroflexi bacterium]|nr:hypothetical protein [Chloroflexota bacterium]
MFKQKIIIALVVVFALSMLTTPALALPPRPTIAPEATAVPPARTIGGWIELRVQNAKAQWSVVQWQDSAGNWIDVDSWRGAFDSVSDGVGKKTWWVDQTSFTTTPFRWVVYDAATKQIVATSQPFNLPTENKQTVSVSVTIAP